MSHIDQQPHELFNLLAESIRLRILCLLQARELGVCDLVDILDLPQPTISRHLAMLRQAGLIRLRRFKRWAYYSLRTDGDPLWIQTQELFSLIRKRNPQVKADAAAVKAKARPACGTLVQL